MLLLLLRCVRPPISCQVYCVTCTRVHTGIKVCVNVICPLCSVEQDRIGMPLSWRHGGKRDAVSGAVVRLSHVQAAGVYRIDVGYSRRGNYDSSTHNGCWEKLQQLYIYRTTTVGALTAALGRGYIIPLWGLLQLLCMLLLWG